MPRREDYRIGQNVRVLDIRPSSMMSEFGGQIGRVTNIEPNQIRADVPSIHDGRNRSLVFDFNFLEIITGVAPSTIYALCSAQIDHENAVVGVFASRSAINQWANAATWLGQPLIVDGDSIFVARQTELLLTDSERPVLHIRVIPIDTMLADTCVSANLATATVVSPFDALVDFDSDATYDDSDDDYDEEDDEE